MKNLLIIRDLAKSRKMTIRELSSRIDLTESAVHKIIKDGKTKMKTLEAIAKVLEVPVQMLLEGNEINMVKEDIEQYQLKSEVEKLSTKLTECRSMLQQKTYQLDLVTAELVRLKNEQK
jgi:transcriptional regulator with XRE-family HTH domain